MKVPELSQPGGRQISMAEQQEPGWHSAVVEAVREIEKSAPKWGLLSVGTTSRRLADALEVTETTGLRYLREVMASGKLVEVDHAARRLLLPWPEDTVELPDVWVNGEVKRGVFRVTKFREVGPAMTRVRFVFSPERLKQVMDWVAARGADKSTKREERDAEMQAARDARTSAAREVFAKHYPVLSGLLERVGMQLGAGDEYSGVRMWAQEHPVAGVVARVEIQADDERFEALEKILCEGLGGEK